MAASLTFVALSNHNILGAKLSNMHQDLRWISSHTILTTVSPQLKASDINTNNANTPTARTDASALREITI
jgi:hypothetical protein